MGAPETFLLAMEKEFNKEFPQSKNSKIYRAHHLFNKKEKRLGKSSGKYYTEERESWEIV